MKRKRIVLLAVAMLLLVGTVALVYTRSREPRYQGRTLNDWLDVNRVLSSYGPGSSNSLIKYKASVHAIRQIGTNAIPALLFKISAKDNALQRHLRSWVDEQRWADFYIPDRGQDRELARNGFSILGADALGAVPALIRLTTDPHGGVRWAALDSLIAINPQPSTLVPILLEALHDPDSNIRDSTRRSLLAQFPDVAEKAGLHHDNGGSTPSNPSGVFTGTTATNK